MIVFGAWSKWTYDPNKYLTDGNLNYCEYYPMMFAFVILIIELVSSLIHMIAFYYLIIFN